MAESGETPCTADAAPEEPSEPSADALAFVTREAFAPEECSICFQNMGGACPVRRLACGHGFHHACIQRWLQQQASCPLCKADAPSVPAPAPAFKVDLGHQEMTQIMTELEDIFVAIHACAGPDRPIALSGLAYNLCVSLGYEDEDELEEAIGGSLADFLAALPHFEVHWPVEEAEQEEEDEAAAAASPSDGAAGEGGGATEGREAAAVATATEAAAGAAAEGTDAKEEAGEEAEAPAAQTFAPEIRATMRPEPSEEELEGRPGSRLTFVVAHRDDLWRVVLQGPRANVEIPELEFAIRPREKRRVDTIYNMIASAVFHLGDHVQKSTRAGVIDDEEVTNICATIDALNVLLDLEQPFTVVLDDPQGVSELKPDTGAHVGPRLGTVEEDGDAALAA